MSTAGQAGSRIHGGPDALGVPLYDFSTNSNACGPCPSAMQAVFQADATRYPDPAYTALRRQLAAFHAVDASRVLLAGSASEFIFRITALAAARGARAVCLPPLRYGDYAQAAAAHGLTFASHPEDAQLLWACDPSSPLGAAQQGLRALAGGRGTRALVVLDRAYEPLRLSAASTLSPQQLNTLWQLWTPNKALGLTGVRAAYAIAPVNEADAAIALEQLCSSWPVGAHGEAMLLAWVSAEAQAWLAASLEILRTWKVRQIAVCESLGWRCLPSEANFFCAQPALAPGLSLQQALAVLRVQGIKLRDTTSFGLPGHVRLGVQPPVAQDALHNAWQQLSRINS